MNAGRQVFYLKLLHWIVFSKQKVPSISTVKESLWTVTSTHLQISNTKTHIVRNLNIRKIKYSFNHHSWPSIHPSASTWMCVGCNPGSMDLEPLKHLWGATKQRYGSPSGTNSPRFCTLNSINGTEVRYTHFSAEWRQQIFFFSPLPLIVEQPTAGAAFHSLVYVTVFTGGDCTGVHLWGVCVCVFLCVCVCVNKGCSQWPELEVIIMYRLVCRDANANAFSLAVVWGPALC